MEIKTPPSVLVCAPQHDSKNYCFDQWADNVNHFTYSNYDVHLVDNSTSIDNTQLIESKGFKASYLKPNEKGVFHTMRDAHNICRELVLDGGYDFMLHLETDVIPPADIIERLMMHEKLIAGASYDINFGSKRQAMVQTDEPFGSHIRFRQVEMIEEDEPAFYDGSLKEVYHIGIGCILIHKNVLERVQFEYQDGMDMHPDTFFAVRCHDEGFPIHCDTSIYCDHLNRSWIGKKQLT
jgi:GT2 family glycosyltransferase